MSRPRAEQLLGLLDNNEITELKADVDQSDRESLALLCSFLLTSINNEEEKGKEEMFQATFGRPWSKNEDYLLRNELRLLTERIYELITRQEREQEMINQPGRSDPFLLAGLLQRRAFRPFESLYKKMREDALQRCDYRTAHRLNELWFRYLIHYKEITPELMSTAHSVLLENLDNLKQAYRNEVAENQHRRIVCEQNLIAMGKEAQQTTIGIDTDLSDHDTPYARYYDAISMAHATQGEEKIEHAQRGLQEIDPIKEIFPERGAFGYAILGSAFFVERLYAQAAEKFEEGITFCRSQHITPPLELLFNFSSTLMRLGEYQKVLALVDEYLEEFQSRPKLYFRIECFRSFCYIFLNDPAKAFESIPPDIGQRPESEYHYFRFIYLILPYLNNDPEGALRETRNFLVYFNRHKGKLLFPNEKKIATIFRHFYSALYNEADRTKQQRELQNVEEEILQFIEHTPQYQDYLYVQWLSSEISKRIEKRSEEAGTGA